MFQHSIKIIENYFCEFTNFKKLPNDGFDDRHTDSGYFISDTDGITNFAQFSGNKVLIASKIFDIYLQYRNDLNDNIIAGLLNLFECSGEQIIRLNTDSVAVYQETNAVNLQENGFSFAKITVELKDKIYQKDCFVC